MSDNDKFVTREEHLKLQAHLLVTNDHLKVLAEYVEKILNQLRDLEKHVIRING